MCFYSDNYRDDDDEITPEDAKAFFDDYDKCSGFDPDDTILLFGCELSRTDLQLCSAFLSRFKTVNSACNALKASDALRNVIGYGKTTADPSTARWNAGYIPGQQVQFWPAGRNGESYLSETTSPAFDTPVGPCVLVADHSEAVPLCNVEPRSIKFPEVSQ